jgi:diguanylate cyclase (GGDEF)-like protein/PAS domain S-box-containing protein
MTMPALSILVVEDNEDDQHLYQRVLRSSGCRVIMTSSAEAGLVAAAETPPDLILLDYNLPDLSGIAFLERLAEVSSASVPTIMLTGEGNEGVAVEAMKAGAADYLVKDTSGGYLRLLPSVISRARASFDQRNHARRLNALHDAILGTVADGILGLDGTGTILFANPAAERMLLSSSSGLVGRSLRDFLRQTDPHATWDGHPLTKPHDGAATLCRECDLFQRHGGSSFPVAYTASPLDFEGGGAFGWVLVFQDITERKKVEEDLIYTARYDTLTGLPNRVMFQDYLAKALARAERGTRHLALLFLDFDGFKAVNDTLGHLAGDQLLQLAAQRLVKSVRIGDLVSRLGGDEFTIVVEDARPTQLVNLAEKILRMLDAPFDLNGHTARISASIGIAVYPECGEDAHTLLQRADNAMYEVKKSGKRDFRFCCQGPCGATGCGFERHLAAKPPGPPPIAPL